MVWVAWLAMAGVVWAAWLALDWVLSRLVGRVVERREAAHHDRLHRDRPGCGACPTGSTRRL